MANSATTENSNSGRTDNDTANKKKTPIKIPIKILILMVLLPMILIGIIIGLILMLIGWDSSKVATNGYYEIDCEDATIIRVDKEYNPIGTATYPLEEYVAGVVNSEVGMFGNIEVYKQFAIAARTYFLRNQSNCTIEASDRRQTFAEVSSGTPNGELMKQAAEETKGQVLLNENGSLINAEYDAFCSIDVDDNYYTLNQKNQKIPRDWVDNTEPAKSGIATIWKDGHCTGNHGRGMSQWGSYYLATEEEYTYERLIAYYLGDDNVTISKKGIFAGVMDLSIKVTANAGYQLDQPINSFLTANGSSLTEYNNYIKSSVEKAGVGTREGVVAAAVSTINFLYDNFDTKLPYYWGGHFPGTIGIPQSFGYNNPSIPSPSGKRYPYTSFDCSGFVNWAIVNGGFIFPDTNQYTSSGRFSICDITNSSCVGKPGDLIDSDSHVVMIIAVDEANNNYYVAESTVSGVIIQTRGMHSKMASESTNVVSLENFYNNKSNVNSNY